MRGTPRIATFAAAALLTLPIAGHSENSQAGSQAAATQQEKPKPPAKKRAKVWTNDDTMFDRPVASPTTEAKQPQPAPAAATKPVTGKPTTPRVGGPAALADPKTPNDADRMIAWEDRDIAAQEQGIADLRKQLDSASPDQKDSLQRLLQNRTQALAETRKEEEALKAKKEELQKNGADGTKTPAGATPQQ